MAQSTLMDDFNEPHVKRNKWRFMSGTIGVPQTKLADGSAALFQRTPFKLLQTVYLNLTFAQEIQFMLHISHGKHPTKGQHDQLSVVYLQCSPDRGVYVHEQRSFILLGAISQMSTMARSDSDGMNLPD